MIHCKTLNKDFADKAEMFEALKHNESRIIAIKKAQVFKSAEKGQISILGVYLKPDTANKAGIETKEGYVYPVINTTKYMDSHDDVHFDGIWKKTINEQLGKIFYVDNHSFKNDDVIAWPEDVQVFTKMIAWKDLGRDYEGETQALIYAIPENKIVKANAKKSIVEKRPLEGSVSMRYIKIEMGIDSTAKQDVQYKKFFDTHIDDIANKEDVKKQGYFFGVTEAKIAGEGSMVLKGSNPITPIIYNEPSSDTHGKQEPPASTQKNVLLNFLN